MAKLVEVVTDVTGRVDVPRSHARERVRGLLEGVGIPEPARRLDGYPHQLSPENAGALEVNLRRGRAGAQAVASGSGAGVPAD